MKTYFLYMTVSALSTLLLTDCGSSLSNSSSSNPSVSESEMAAGSVGGSAGVNSGGQARYMKKPSSFYATLKSSMTLIDTANASIACPTFTNNSAACSASSSAETLTYSGCSFNSFNNSWNGSQLLTFSGGYTPSCSAPPAFASGNTMVRTWASGTNVAVPSGYTVTIDAPGSNATSSGWNTPTYDNGVTIAFSGPTARTITINGLHLLASWNGLPVFDHTISSSALSVNSSNVITSGTITLQHNYAKYVATSTFNNVGFTAGCCFPTSGSITTTFSNSSASETLSFNSTCGSSTYNGVAHTLSYCF